MDLDQDGRAETLYAAWLDWLVRVAFGVSLGAFALYASGALEPAVPLAALPELWRLPLDQYLARTGSPTGWRWLGFTSYSDYLNLAAIALYALITLVCYLRVIAALPRLHAALAGVQAAVLLAAMSGLF